MSNHTKGNLRATIIGLLADEQRGCDQKHLDTLLEKLAIAANCHDELLTALKKAEPALWILAAAGAADAADRHALVLGAITKGGQQ